MIAARYTLLEQHDAADLIAECADRGVAVVAGAAAATHVWQNVARLTVDVPDALWARLIDA